MRALSWKLSGRRVGTLLVLLAGLQACQAPAPRSRALSSLGDVRAGSQELADEVALMVDDLHPQVTGSLPDAEQKELDVWIQEEPMLYRFISNSYEEADGFWAELPSRIHLRRNADDLERTLAHELTHATLGSTWRFLPGTIEEGLCDFISARICPESAPAMRAGRLSAASFAIGGLELELQLDHMADNGVLLASYSARVLLQSGGSIPLDPLDVFDVRAGLSSTKIDSSHKKAFYGLSYVVVNRVVERHGIEGLHELCLRSEREDESEIPGEWLLEAAGLDSNRMSWQRAISSAFGEAELEELVAMYPQFLSEAMKLCKTSFPPLFAENPTAPGLDLELRLSLPYGGASVVLEPRGFGRMRSVDLATAGE